MWVYFSAIVVRIVYLPSGLCVSAAAALRIWLNGNAAVDEVFNKFLIPQMFAEVAQDKMTPQEAAKTFDKQMKAVFAKWRAQKKI